MNEDENNRTVRFFQWVDDEGRYSKNSIYARLIQRQKRIIRNVENEEPLDEGKLCKYLNHVWVNKVGCVFLMVRVSILPHAEFGQNDHREDAPYLNKGLATTFDSSVLNKVYGPGFLSHPLRFMFF